MKLSKDMIILLLIVGAFMFFQFKPQTIAEIDILHNAQGQSLKDFSVANPMSVSLRLEKMSSFFKEMYIVPNIIPGTPEVTVYECAPIYADALGNLGNCLKAGYRDVFHTSCPAGKVSCVGVRQVPVMTMVTFSINTGEGANAITNVIHTWNLGQPNQAQSSNIANIVNEACYSSIVEGIDTGGQGSQCRISIKATADIANGGFSEWFGVNYVEHKDACEIQKYALTHPDKCQPITPPPRSNCGDTICAADESPQTCSQDCVKTPPLPPIIIDPQPPNIIQQLIDWFKGVIARILGFAP